MYEAQFKSLKACGLRGGRVGKEGSALVTAGTEVRTWWRGGGARGIGRISQRVIDAGGGVGASRRRLLRDLITYRNSMMWMVATSIIHS